VRENRHGTHILEIEILGSMLCCDSSLCCWIVHCRPGISSNEVRADSNRVFELRIYHALPGKLPAMESRFRDTTSKLLVKHDLNVIGYWIPDSKSPAWDNAFVFLLAHSSREEAEKNWREMAADPAFQEIIKSEQKERLLDKADTTYMQPTDFSAMK
jgi:hypothetical protein